MDWELEVSGQLEEFGNGIIGQMGIGWIFGYKKERIFKIIVRKEVIRTD
jgi:hypothetical protein